MSHLQILGHVVPQNKGLYYLLPTHYTQEDIAIMAALPAGMDLNNVPALEPPTGETSNLVDPYNINICMYITASIGLGLSMLAVIVRIVAKGHVMRTIQLEEVILLLSQCGFIAFVGLMIHSTKLGQGTHQWNVSVAHFQKVVEVCIYMIP